MLKSNLRDVISSEVKEPHHDDHHDKHHHHHEEKVKPDEEILNFKYKTFNDFFKSTADDDIKVV